MLNKKLLAALVFSGALLGGCASVPMASPDADAKAKTFAVQADAANVYIYRNESFGAAIKMTVVLDGQIAGDTAANTYIMKTVAPGKHTLISKTENDSTIEINAESGKNYYIWQEVKMGAFAARSNLQVVDETTGQKGVSECKLVQ